MRPFHQVPVYIHGHLYGLVSEHLLDDAGADAPLKQHNRGEGVLEVVEGQVGAPSSPLLRVLKQLRRAEVILWEPRPVFPRSFRKGLPI